jgi:putative transcriptional regulator
MPIIFNLDVMLAKRKMTLTQLSHHVNISIVNLSILKTGKAKALRIITLNNICKALKCQPGDLMEYIDNDAYRELFGHDWDGEIDGFD